MTDNRQPALPTIAASERWHPPYWAVLERQLFDTLNRAAVEFVARYTRPDGTLIWRDNWPGMDGSDDPYEAFMYLALLYALGSSEEVRVLADRMWEAITWQWTEYGQIHREFDGYYDWMHHGEGYLFFYFLGLAEPDSLKNRQRAVRFAGFYTGDDPEAPNYDKEKRMMRSPLTGSRGPRHTMTEEDWITHRGVLDDYLAPFEDVPNVPFASGKCPWSDDAVYRDIIRLMNERQARGDVPINLNATGLVTHAYMYTGDEAYRSWVLDYIEAWEERTARNGGLIPDNVGLSDVIGEYNDGKWWGGYYGWRWPHGFMTIVEPLLNAGMNAQLLTGDSRWLQLVRSQIDKQWEFGREENGQWVVPHRHYDAGWTDYRAPNAMYPIYLWTVTMAQEDLERAQRIAIPDWWKDIDVPPRSDAYPDKDTKHYIANTIPWFLYMQGQFPDYPERILQANHRLVAQQLDKMRSADGDPLSWDWEHPYSIHQWQEYCPVYFEGLLQMTLGAPMHLSHGGLQHASVRYYDAERKRPGLPESVGALVEHVDADGVTLSLVNLDPFAAKEAIVQAGTFGEHAFSEAQPFGEDGAPASSGPIPVGGKWLSVRLAPGAGIKLRLGMKRYVNKPSYETPWSEAADRSARIRGRQQDGE